MSVVSLAELPPEVRAAVVGGPAPGGEGGVGAGGGKRRKREADYGAAAGSQLEMPRCRLCHEWLVARMTKAGPAFPCGCAGRRWEG